MTIRHVVGHCIAFWVASSLGLSAAHGETLVLRASRIYSAPEAAPIRNGIVILSDGKIRAVGPQRSVRVPAGAVESSCNGGVIAAGFHNSHVHLTGDQFANAAERPAAELTRAFSEMLTGYGFTTVTDTASLLPNTLALRARVANGEVAGPRILTAGIPLYPPDGLPFYLRGTLPPEVLSQLPQPSAPDAALAVVQANLGAGADGTKLFIATPQGDGSVKRMPSDIARAASDATHQRGKLVMSHPTDIEGVRAAVAAGVDIVVHTTLGDPGAWPADLVSDMLRKKVSVVPTLQLWPYELRKGTAPPPVRERLIAATLAQLQGFASAGGQVLFGTDVGYMTEFDPSLEYELMAKAGLSTTQILATLTTAPAARWNESKQRGRVAPGLDADLVVLAADPAEDARNFAKVRCTWRGGKVIYSKPSVASSP